MYLLIIIDNRLPNNILQILNLLSTLKWYLSHKNKTPTLLFNNIIHRL